MKQFLAGVALAISAVVAHAAPVTLRFDNYTGTNNRDELYSIVTLGHYEALADGVLSGDFVLFSFEQDGVSQADGIGIEYKTDAESTVSMTIWDAAWNMHELSMPSTGGIWKSVHFELPSSAVTILLYARGEPFLLESMSFNLVNLVPEPSPVALIGAGLAGLIWVRRRKDTREMA